MKLPSLVRRMSVQEAREASLQKKGPKNKFERRILEELPKAVKRVEDFYGVKLESLPPVLISHKTVRADKVALLGYLEELHRSGRVSQAEFADGLEWLEKQASLTGIQRIFQALREFRGTYVYIKLLLFPSAWYNAALPSISLPPKRSTRFSTSYLPDLLGHELIHHMAWEQRSGVYGFRKESFSLSDGHLASMCANEGLAVYSESWAHKEPEKGFVAKLKSGLSRVANAYKQAFISMCMYPERLFANLTHLVLSIPSLALRDIRLFAWNTPEKLAKAVEKSKLARMAINPYRDGLRFVRIVSKELGGPKEAFKAITEKPPETMQEVLLPEKYLETIRPECPSQ